MFVCLHGFEVPVFFKIIYIMIMIIFIINILFPHLLSID
jgi:hypothetical protein